MENAKETNQAREIQIAVLKQMSTLATSAFGVVAALAWNSFIQEFVSMYVRKYFPESSGMISLFIYAVVVTILAVVITMNLSKLTSRLEEKAEQSEKSEKKK